MTASEKGNTSRISPVSFLISTLLDAMSYPSSTALLINARASRTASMRAASRSGKLGSFPVFERSGFRQDIEVEAWHSKSFKARQDKSLILPFRSVQINSIGHAFVIGADALAATVRNRTDSWRRGANGLSF
ncbi:hypothetical protein HFN90_32790 [Rhizobium laguerreae]|nr:hypothetical protein [Rhizobium laguerreae]MBY3390432.1 hypothetical protein [Rhizobium laguerreae]MBY3404092.1 hypothetical protein [Rhizobium laguerreae]MBY3411034.1 hypothetical protein [Rhizobium laguerreae]